MVRTEAKALNASPRKGMKNMSRSIGNAPSNAIKFVKRDAHTNDGKPEGTLTANPTVIDGVIIRA